MFCRKVGLASLCLMTAGLFFSSTSPAQLKPFLPGIQLSGVTGGVWIMKTGSHDKVLAINGYHMEYGDQLIVDEDARADIEIKKIGGGMVYVRSNTELHFDYFTGPEIYLEKGSIVLQPEKTKPTATESKVIDVISGSFAATTIDGFLHIEVDNAGMKTSNFGGLVKVSVSTPSGNSRHFELLPLDAATMIKGTQFRLKKQILEQKDVHAFNQLVQEVDPSFIPQDYRAILFERFLLDTSNVPSSIYDELDPKTDDTENLKGINRVNYGSSNPSFESKIIRQSSADDPEQPSQKLPTNVLF